MDWLIPLLFVVVSIALSASNDKKKKRQAAEKRAQQARQAGQPVQSRQTPQPKVGHPYAESAKDKGMTLDDFRRRYENMGGGKKPQPAASSKPATVKTQAAKPARQTQPKPVQMDGSQGMPQSESRAEQWKPAAKSQPKPKKSVPVTGVDIGSQAKESPVMAGVMAKKNELHTEFGTDAVAFVNSKNLSPMQQGLLWAEILGAPKAKQRRGGRY